jgi:hypothetical protein
MDKGKAKAVILLLVGVAVLVVGAFGVFHFLDEDAMQADRPDLAKETIKVSP